METRPDPPSIADTIVQRIAWATEIRYRADHRYLFGADDPREDRTGPGGERYHTAVEKPDNRREPTEL